MTEVAMRDVLAILGLKEVEISKLREENSTLRQALARLEEKPIDDKKPKSK